jgi:hypothetical protein
MGIRDLLGAITNMRVFRLCPRGKLLLYLNLEVDAHRIVDGGIDA